jgi:LPS sulfotransferase NodH
MAKAICCTRGRQDTALSLWFQVFASPATNFCYRLSDIRRVMDDFDCVIQLWKRLQAIHEVVYERLVSDPQGEVYRMLEFIGATEPYSVNTGTGTCRRAISTASFWQARQSVYTSSVGRYKNYIKWIPELKMF